MHIRTSKPRAVRPSIIALIVPCALAAAACDGDDAGPPSSVEIHPVLLRETVLRPTSEAAADELPSDNIAPGTAYRVLVYEVPELACVRSDTDDYLHIPEASTTPGGPGVLYAIPPADESRPVALVLHGNGLDFIEGATSLFTHMRPEDAEMFFTLQPSLTEYADISSRASAVRSIEATIDDQFVGQALERGWGIVLPGNCWGDAGHGEGEDVVFPEASRPYYAAGPRYGHTMDRGAWDWYRKTFPHDARREYSIGCSGGGQRSAQLLMRDPHATAASFIDSPADYLPGFLEEPVPAIFQLLAGLPIEVIMEGFFVGHYGGIEGARRASLGVRMMEAPIDTPIYLTYSLRDPLTTAPVTAQLVAALSSRAPDSDTRVFESGLSQHCQVSTAEGVTEALDWLLQFERTAP